MGEIDYHSYFVFDRFNNANDGCFYSVDDDKVIIMDDNNPKFVNSPSFKLFVPATNNKFSSKEIMNALNLAFKHAGNNVAKNIKYKEIFSSELNSFYLVPPPEFLGCIYYNEYYLKYGMLILPEFILKGVYKCFI